MPITAHDTAYPPVSQPGAGELADSAQRIDYALATFLQSKVGLFSEPPALREVFELTRRFVLTGGKRLRPVLCWWGWCGAGGDAHDPNILTAAASLELFPAFALIHDDIMDASDTRRGHPTLHRALATLHSERAGHGDSHRIGTSLAILSGDLCLAWSDEMLHTSELPPDRIRAALPLLHQMRTEIVTGQYLDLLDH